ncbi:MAG: transglutaminase domain-containing protein [Terriglobia bacterium]|jgi:hypothetical protein
MHRTNYGVFTLVVATLVVRPAAGQNNVKDFSVIIDKPAAEYIVDVGGTMDPENLEITIENLGDKPIVNPRLTINGLYDWYDAKSMAAEITRNCKTDEEKARAIWAWVRYKTYQRSPQDPMAVHPVRAMNGFGYGICGHVACWMKCLWTAAGLPARIQELWGHTVSEVYYDGAWHMLDANVKVFYLDRDNRTIASLATLEHDPWLIQRAIHPRDIPYDPWLQGPDPPERNQQFVHYITSYMDNYEEHSYDRELAKDYTMAMTLKPGEKFIRWWTPELGKYEARDANPEVPWRYANGQLIWEPDLRRIDARPYLTVESYSNIATRQQDGRGPAIHVADLQDSVYTRPSVFTIPVVSPYPIVGGHFSCTLVKEGSSGPGEASVYFGAPRWESADLHTFRGDQGSESVDLYLDHKLAAEGAVCHYGIGIALRGNAESMPPTEAGVEAFRSVTDLQISPQSIPALALGKNTVRFWSESQGPVKVRITERWREVDGRWPPGKVTAAVTPTEGAEVASLAPTLKWSPPPQRDPSARIVDYQVMVSPRPDCRWPVSTTLEQHVGSDKLEWTVPPTFLNPGTTYYWRVRARNSRGDIGDWGPAFSFRTAANAGATGK